MSNLFRACAVGALSLAAAPFAAQDQQAPVLAPLSFCGQQTPAPRAQPPAGSAPIVLALGPCFEAQGGTSVIEPQTYLYYIQLKASRPSENVWVPYDESTE